MTMSMLRPVFAAVLGLTLLGASAGGDASDAGRGVVAQIPHEGRLTTRPGSGGANCAPRTHTLKLGPGRTALMRVTGGSQGGRKALVLALHGAGGASTGGLWVFRGGWSTPGVVMVAPTAEGGTWNIFLGSDLNSIDRALRRAFARCRIDPSRIAVGGFSDGATTALSLGILNGDLFGTVMAIAPGGLIAEKPVGKPRVYVAHGTRDTVIPTRISDNVARLLRSSGYSVTLRKFRGGHEVPYPISKAAVRWFLRS